MATDQKDEIKALFDAADKSGDGKISTRELGKMFKRLGFKLSVEDVKSLVIKFDSDGSHNIDLEEFRALITDVLGANKQYEEAYEVFRMFDKNGDNTITVDEAKKACADLPKPLSDVEFEEFMKRLDADGNGVVCFDEFAKAYACGL